MKYLFLLALIIFGVKGYAQTPSVSNPSSSQSVFLRSPLIHNGANKWVLKQASSLSVGGKVISAPDYVAKSWLNAVVPGTVLTSLVADKVYPDPYFGINNKRSQKLIPDMADVGREFYHYWYRTEFRVPKNFTRRRTWLKFHGINYRCTLWLNGKKLGTMAGMFNTQSFDVTDLVSKSGPNALAVDMQPVDFPGSYFKPGVTQTGAPGENHNGGDGEIGKNVTMLMSVGWDFTSPDGIRDRNTGIWRDVELYTTGDVVLENPFVQTKLPLPDTTTSSQTISVEVKNATKKIQTGILSGNILESKSNFSKKVTLQPNETKTITFSPKEYKSLIIRQPKLWWPINKGKQNLYNLTLNYTVNSKISHVIHTKFGIREITSDQKTPDKSRRFYVNGQPIFVRGTNWVPEAMLRNSPQRTYAELRYTKQAGVNLLRLWGGGIAESDYFYQLCDEYGFLVWNEFWITADTHLPVDSALYFKNVTSTVKRIRNHASSAYYVAANEGGELPGTGKLIHELDSTRGYQVQSECCGVHDGSPYKYENPMQYFENTASKRGSRVDGFNPEYGTPCIPIAESIKRMMPVKDQWPITDSVWNYLDGNGFHQITTKYREAVDEFGKSSSIDEFAQKAQFVGAMNYRAIWEVWNYNKFNYGDRFASGFLFWYHNSPLPQTASRMYDWYLEPTAALYYSQNALAPLHAQFDYIKNTVSVYNDFRVSFSNYQVEATVYDLNAKPVWNKSVTIQIPKDGVVNDAIKIDFPTNISQVHFIKLRLKDSHGKLVNDAFYWRSKDIYKGAWTMTGPAVSGFEDINKLPKIRLKTATTYDHKGNIKVTVKNPSKSISFFTQLKLQQADGSSINPAFYTDNFFSLLPGETKTIDIQFEPAIISGSHVNLITNAFNCDPQTKSFNLKGE
ncbi:mannosylglycoprotein endo-beta-mannosidase [Pedobacter sp. UYP30]|uniref:glycoside hydrolase family 2 protein n=1 Tax=Pedobacter sp. UYP30 TaxID=1756400 RepID=UPI00339B21C8